MPLARTRITRFESSSSKQALGADFTGPDNDNYRQRSKAPRGRFEPRLASLVSFQFMMNSPPKVAAIVPPVKLAAASRPLVQGSGELSLSSRASC